MATSGREGLGEQRPIGASRYRERIESVPSITPVTIPRHNQTTPMMPVSIAAQNGSNSQSTRRSMAIKIAIVGGVLLLVAGMLGALFYFDSDSALTKTHDLMAVENTAPGTAPNDVTLLSTAPPRALSVDTVRDYVLSHKLVVAASLVIIALVILAIVLSIVLSMPETAIVPDPPAPVVEPEPEPEPKPEPVVDPESESDFYTSPWFLGPVIAGGFAMLVTGTVLFAKFGKQHVQCLDSPGSTLDHAHDPAIGLNQNPSLDSDPIWQYLNTHIESLEKAANMLEPLPDPRCEDILNIYKDYRAIYLLVRPMVGSRTFEDLNVYEYTRADISDFMIVSIGLQQTREEKFNFPILISRTNDQEPRVVSFKVETLNDADDDDIFNLKEVLSIMLDRVRRENYSVEQFFKSNA